MEKRKASNIKKLHLQKSPRGVSSCSQNVHVYFSVAFFKNAPGRAESKFKSHQELASKKDQQVRRERRKKKCQARDTKGALDSFSRGRISPWRNIPLPRTASSDAAGPVKYARACLFIFHFPRENTRGRDTRVSNLCMLKRIYTGYTRRCAGVFFERASGTVFFSR